MTSAPDVSAPKRSEQITIVDFGGHPFTGELAGQLNEQGYDVSYSCCPSNVMSPAGDLERLRREGLEIDEITLGARKQRGPLEEPPTFKNPRAFEKHKAVGRLRDELWYGYLLARRVRSETVVACQLPLVSGWILLVATKLRGGRYINWLQDFQADLAGLTSSSRTARILSFLESRQIRAAHHVICISNGFAARVRDLGRSGPTTVLPNWAPIERLDVCERDNDWARAIGLRPDSVRISYSGTLGSKHRVGDLSRIVKELLPYGQFEFIFTAAGQGYEELRFDSLLARSDRVHFLGFQDYQKLPQVLGAADVLIATLDPVATEACVPSKVLSYLCAGRPVVALMDRSCPSAQLVLDAGAGEVAATAEEVVEAIFNFGDEPESAQLAGKSGRDFAERHFAAAETVQRFVAAAGLSYASQPRPAPAETR